MDFEHEQPEQIDLRALADARVAEAARWRMPARLRPPQPAPPPPAPSRVVSPSLAPSQVAHTTPSPACTDEDNAHSLRQSLKAQADARQPLPEQQVAERRRQLGLMRAAMAAVPIGRSLWGK